MIEVISGEETQNRETSEDEDLAAKTRALCLDHEEILRGAVS